MKMIKVILFEEAAMFGKVASVVNSQQIFSRYEEAVAFCSQPDIYRFSVEQRFSYMRSFYTVQCEDRGEIIVPPDSELPRPPPPKK